MSTVYYNETHQRIVESGISAIKTVLMGDDTSEILSVLLCLDFYLDPYYKNTLSYEKEIFDLLQELVVSTRNDDVIGTCLQLIGDYCTFPLAIMEKGFDKIKDNWRPDVRYILDRP